ncbi:T9SS sorting signal type C domain-containing protein, partial [Flavobacterium aquidurense]|uniref:T9SS sorting signal type C domain-containing protein n=1 Tax=Flavobacterium aquidurense TaxID=362413 RepID=UPI00285B000E
TAAPANTTNGVVPATTTYTWTAPTVVTGLSGGVAGSGATITGTLTNSTNAALSTTYSVTPVTGGCTGTAFNLTVTVNPKPAINAMATSACSGTLFTAAPANTTNGVVPATTTYTWTAPTVVTGLSGGVAGSGASITGTLTNSTNAALSTTYSVTPITGGCTGTAFNLTVTVNPTPTTPTISAGGPLTFCAGDSVTLTSSTGTTYLWSNGATTQSITVSTSGIYSVQITNAAGCQSAASVGTTVNSYAKTWLGLSNVWADGANWSPSGIPTNTDCVVISGTVPFQPETLPALIKINSITINNGGLLTIQSQNVLDVNNGVTVNAGGNLIFEDDSSLLQTNPNSINTGNIIYKRNTTPVRRYDYTYWSTPVTNTPAPTFKLSDLSPDTLVDKFFSYSPSSGWVYNNYGTQVMEPGMGYNVRAPQTFDINIPKIYNAQFTGIPNNGTIPVTPVIDKFILLGNPYPSGLDAGNFISTNNTGALYFWTHTSNPTSTGNGTYAYASADYATYTKLGGSGAGSLNFQNPPTGIIAAGQAFFIKATSATSIPIIFTNGMRVGAGNTQFYKTTNAKTPDLNRIWLNLTNKQGAFKQVLLGYADGATNSWDVNYDGPTMSGNSYVDFYSINDTKKLTIQGRALPFDDSDLVPFGYVTKVAGDFTIAIDHADGFFDTQAVYLEDKKTGKITDLRASNYTFTTAIGTFTDRFVLRYTNKTLGTGDFENVENGLLISVKNKVIKTTSSKEIIKDITIFDISGKVLYDKKKVGTTELEISNLKAADQVLLVKVLLENGYSTTRKIIF